MTTALCSGASGHGRSGLALMVTVRRERGVDVAAVV